MPKLVAGFLLGVIATLVVVYWSDHREQEVDTHFIDQPSPVDELNQSPQPDPDGPNKSVSEDRVNRTNAPRQTESPVKTGPVAAQPPSSATAQSQAKPDASATSARAIDYPPEIAEMIENRVDKELQSRYENDAREESWAAYMEALLADYFAQKPGLAQFYFSLIDCRTSVCSVHVLGYGPDALTLWNTATADLVSQQWFDFNNMSVNRRNPEPDVLAIVLILTKKPPE